MDMDGVSPSIRRADMATVDGTARPSVCLGSLSLQAGNGGIARVARLMARVLAEEVSGGRADVVLLDLLDREACADVELPTQLAHGSKLRFAMRAVQAARTASHFIYDGCHLAQLQWLPCLRKKPCLAFLHGIELWDASSPRYFRAARRAKSLLANSSYTLRRTEALHGRLPQAQVCWLATEADDPAE